MAFKEEERLHPSIEKIIKGINEFFTASQHRIESEDWGWTHKTQLNNIRKELSTIQIELIELKKQHA